MESELACYLLIDGMTESKSTCVTYARFSEGLPLAESPPLHSQMHLCGICDAATPSDT